MKQYSPQGFLNFQDLLDKTHINTKILFTTIIKIDNEQGIFQMIVPCLNQEDIATVMDEKLNSRVDIDIVEININESQFWIKEQDYLNRTLCERVGF